MPTMEAIANRLVSSNEQGFMAGRRAAFDLAVDPLDIRHVPEWPGDGPMSRAKFLSVGEHEDEAWRAALADVHQEEVSASIVGDVVELKRTLCGTRPDGTEVRIPLRNLYSVADGKVVRIVPHLEGGVMDLIRDVLRAGGFDPDREYESD